MLRRTNKCCPTCDSHLVHVLRTELPAEPKPRPHAPVINHTACVHCGRRGVLVTTMREHEATRRSTAQRAARGASNDITGRWVLDEVVEADEDEDEDEADDLDDLDDEDDEDDLDEDDDLDDLDDEDEDDEDEDDDLDDEDDDDLDDLDDEDDDEVW